MKGVMIQGTASDVGKSFIVTALCRLFVNEGYKVTPFKSQNMSNNSYVTLDGKEIGRAQGIQAEAAKIEATVWMNPILLKPRSNLQSEVVYLGKAEQVLSGVGYRETFYEKGLAVIQSALTELQKEFDVVIIEGAGSPVEINLKDKELVNMKVAEIADVPVILVADIDRGGVFASIVGTLELLTEDERRRVKGVIINKFRGDIHLFEDGISWLEEKTGIPVLGVLPYIENHMIDGEDSLSIQNNGKSEGADLDIAVIQLPFISNYSDIEPFMLEEDVRVRWVKNAAEFGNPDAVIIPGTKSTIKDLQYIKQNGLVDRIYHHIEKAKPIIGICGGFQMLGKELIDEAGTDTGTLDSRKKGLNIIPAVTTFYQHKETVRTKGRFHPSTKLSLKREVEGYEVHLGRTEIENGCYFLELDNGQAEGYYDKGGKVIGTYIHHLFHNDELRNHWLNQIRESKGLPRRKVLETASLKAQKYDELANHVMSHLNWEQVLSIVNGRKQNEVD
ncbi:cobyric acid synthase [Bacillus sp. 31A1R]|uniref:Cobyric acid synthase n=1 Tax=Robertmurraya mangrovi TaxID=3098077 RepID=A0ABU5J4A8_9BACI|nr:cobyric acid synthase [Bacillus sp. 31A1R]MDZ5474212.1 cobyric acid synthase [Bacillus sp. 31A1R]